MGKLYDYFENIYEKNKVSHAFLIGNTDFSLIEKEIYDIAGCEFNIMSPKQLGEILFIKMELPYPKKIKDNNYSTSKDILDKVAPYSPIVDKILDYRTLAKLLFDE